MTSKECLEKLSYIPIYEEDIDIIFKGDLCEVYRNEVDIISKDLEMSEILKTIFKSIIKNYDDINQNFTVNLNTELYDKLKELLNDK